MRFLARWPRVGDVRWYFTSSKISFRGQQCVRKATSPYHVALPGTATCHKRGPQAKSRPNNKLPHIRSADILEGRKGGKTSTPGEPSVILAFAYKADAVWKLRRTFLSGSCLILLAEPFGTDPFSTCLSGALTPPGHQSIWSNLCSVQDFTRYKEICMPQFRPDKREQKQDEKLGLFPVLT